MFSEKIFDNTEVAFASQSATQLKKAHWLFSLMGIKPMVDIGSHLTNFSFRLRLPVAPIFKYTIYNQFCGGESFAECKKTIDKLAAEKIFTLINYGVELKETEEDFGKTVERNLESIRFASSNKSVKAVCIKVTGFGRFALLESIQNKEKLSAEEKAEWLKVKERLAVQCAAAHEANVQLYIDAEESWIQDPIDDIVNEMMLKFNQKRAIVFNTFQLYRTDRLAFLKKSFELMQSKKCFLGAKIVRGAYMEKERKRAEEMGYSSPIFDTKSGTDKAFDSALDYCFDHIQEIGLCVASQSEESTLHAMNQMKQKKISFNEPNILFSQLYGMGDNITYNLANLGFNASKYLPYGPVKEVIPYLLRRALENTSVGGQVSRELSLINEEIKRRKNK